MCTPNVRDNEHAECFLFHIPSPSLCGRQLEGGEEKLLVTRLKYRSKFCEAVNMVMAKEDNCSARDKNVGK